MSIRTRKIIHIIFYVFFALLIGYGIYSFISFYFKPNKLVELNAKYITLYEGDVYPLQGEYKLDDGSLAKIIYSINNENVAEINRETGVIIAKKSGKATLFATVEDDSSIYSEANIKVVKQDMNNNKVIVNDKEVKINRSDEKRVYVSIGKTTPSRVTYRSQNENVVKVTEDGVLKPVAGGEAKVEVLLDGENPQVVNVKVADEKPTTNNSNSKNNSSNSNTTNNTKTNKTVNVTGITINKQYVNLYKGEGVTLITTINPSDATNKKVSWSTSNKKVATVDQNGNVKAIGVGTAAITVTTADGNKSAAVKVTVIDKTTTINVEKININRANYILTSGGSEQISYSVVPSNATNKNITWSSSNNKVVKVDSNGKLTGVSAGTATITAKSVSGITVTAKVKVYQSGLAVADTYNATDQAIVYSHNVLEYGADPYGQNDSTAAFKKAINDANNCVYQSNCNGYTIFVPSGRYIIKESLDLGPAVGLIGDLKEGSTSGTILQIEHGAGSTNYNNAAIKMDTQSAVMNIAFWYPNQSADNSGYTNSYPPTIIHKGGYGITIKNVNFVNSFTAMDFANSHFDLSLQQVSNIYGSPLFGVVVDGCFDVLRLTNVNFNSSYWLNSGLSNIPNSSNVNAALKNRGEGLILERIDWFYLTGIKLDGYNVGFRLRNSTHHVKNSTQPVFNSDGEMFDIKATNCNNPLYVESARVFTISNATLKSSSNAAAIQINNSDRISINNSTISGANAINNNGSSNISFTNCTLSGNINRANNNAKYSFTNCNLTNTNYNGSSVNINVGSGATAIDYNKKVVNKPKSNKVVTISATKGSDITSKVRDAINSLKSTGGIVYIPSGNYVISDHIDVYSGIEIRGTTPWFHDWIQRQGTNGNFYEYSTRISTAYKNDVLFTLYSNSGINGLTIMYDNPNLAEYPFTIRGNGSNIYITNLSLPNAWQGIDLATYKCDNHYVDMIYGQYYKVGIRVGGGSSNGIVKNSHININTLYYLFTLNGKDSATFYNHWKYLVNNQISYEVGNSNNELFFNNFVYNSKLGFNVVNGANNFTLLSCGADAVSWVSHHVSGNVKGQIVNAIMEPMAGNDKYCYRYNGSACYLAGNNVSERRYLKFGDSYSGYVNVINSISWGNVNDSTAFEFAGKGDIHINGGVIHTTASPAIINRGALLSTFGLIIAQNPSVAYEFNTGTNGAGIINSVCDFGNCSNRLVNNSGINIGVNNNGIK